MLLIIYLVAILMLLAGVLLLIKPAFVLGFMDKYGDSAGLYAGAILARLLLGGLLIYYASLSRYPLTVAVIGWIAVVAALAFIVMGKARFTRMLKWVMRVVRPWGRAGGLAALVFGAFLLYAFA